MEMARTPLRIGVIGAGWFVSRRHLPDIQRHPDATIAALCRRDQEALVRLRDRFAPDAAIYTDWRQMLAECPLDAVLIATPHALHYEPAREALERGLHVLLEKPMTVRAEEARHLRDLAAERGRTLSVALNPPFWAHCHRIHDTIEAGRIGRLEAVDIFWVGNAEFVFGEAPLPENLPGVVPPTLYRADPDLCGGGFFIDGGSHLVSEVLWVTGLRAKRVACLMDTLPSDRRAALSLLLENDVTVSMICIGNSRSGARRVSSLFAGAKGVIRVQGGDFQTTVEIEEGEPEVFRESDLLPVPGPVASFVAAIREGAPLPSPPEHGVHVVEVVEAAYRSARTGQAVDLE